MLKIEKLILCGAVMLDCAGHATSVSEQLESELGIHRERVFEARRKIEERFANCKLCKGSGEILQDATCMTCRGTGVFLEKKGSTTISKSCAKCKNSGLVSLHKACPKCRPYDVHPARSAESAVAQTQPKCDKCKGRGRIVKEEACSACNGQGGIRIPPKQLVSGWSKERWSKCSVCNASGKKSVWGKCLACNGRGVPQGDDENNIGQGSKDDGVKPNANKWLRHSAEKGNAKAQYCIGVMCALGDGVPKNQAEAVMWLTKAAEQNHDEAQSLLSLVRVIHENEQKKVESERYVRAKAAGDVCQRDEFEKNLANIASERSCFEDGCEISANWLYVSVVKRKSGGFNYKVSGECNAVSNTRLYYMRRGVTWTEDVDWSHDLSYLILSDEREWTNWMDALKAVHAKVLEWVDVAAKNGINEVEKEIPIGRIEVFAHNNLITKGKGQRELFLSSIRECVSSDTPVKFFCKMSKPDNPRRKGEYDGHVTAQCGYFKHEILSFSGDKTSINNDILLLLERYNPEALKKAYLEYVRKQDIFK